MLSLSQLIITVASKTGLPRHEVKIVAETLFEEILLGICSCSKVQLTRFGRFDLRKRSDSKGPGYIKFTQSRLEKKILYLFQERNRRKV